MSSQSTFSVSNSLVYQQPPKDVSGELNFLEFQPISGQSFSAGNQFEINVASSDSFIDPSKTWLQYTLTGTAGTTNTGGSLNATIGGVAVIKRIDSIVSGVEIESIDNYNHYYAMISKRQPRTYRDQLLPELEGTSKVFYTTTSSEQAYVVNHALRIGLFEGQQRHIPVCFMRSGLNLRFTLDTSAYVANATVTGWTVSNVRLVCGMLKPNPAYLQDFQRRLESGGSAVIPMQLVRNLNFVCTTSTSQEAQLTCGYLKSLRSIMGAFRTTTANVFDNDTRNSLSEFFFQNSTTRYPLNKTVKTGARNGENLMIALSSIDNTYAHFGVPSAISANTDHLIYYSFASNAEFGSGISVVDGAIRFTQVYESAPLALTAQMYCTFDAKLVVSAGSVALDTLNI
jgi:hypothetical protein